MRCIGIDLHKHYAQIVEITADGSTDEYRIPLPDGLTELKERLGHNARVVVEASTNSFRFHEEIAPFVGSAVVAHSNQTRGAIAHSAVTDRRAAEALARLLASGFIRTVWVPPAPTRALRNLVAHRADLNRVRTATTQRLRALFQQELLQDPGRQLYDSETRDFLDGVFYHEPSLRLYAASLMRLKDAVQEERDRVDSLLAAWVWQSEEARLLLSIPGVGPTVSAYLMADIGDIGRFPSPRKLCSYAGIVPRVYESGKVKRRGSISRAGRPLLRWAAGIAATQAVRLPGSLQDFFQNVASRRPKKVAIVATARKLLTVAWHVLTRREPHRGHDPDLYQRKLKRLRWVASKCGDGAL